jgi:hypothetical protein
MSKAHDTRCPRLQSSPLGSTQVSGRGGVTPESRSSGDDMRKDGFGDDMYEEGEKAEELLNSDPYAFLKGDSAGSG